MHSLRSSHEFILTHCRIVIGEPLDVSSGCCSYFMAIPMRLAIQVVVLLYRLPRIVFGFDIAKTVSKVLFLFFNDLHAACA